MILRRDLFFYRQKRILQHNRFFLFLSRNGKLNNTIKSPVEIAGKRNKKE